jgi:hypothetical protein
MKNKTLRGSAFAAPFERAHKDLGNLIYTCEHTSVAGNVRDAAFKGIKNPVMDATPYRCVGWYMSDLMLFVEGISFV